MFTGIVQAVGTIVRVAPLEIDCPALDLADVGVGDSICVQGVCLTVTAVKGASFSADVSSETLSVTVGVARAGAAVNLEKSLALGERLGGHLVTGHVDGVGDVLTFAEGLLKVRVPRELARHAHLEEALGESQDVPDTVDVPGDEVAAEPLAERERLLEVDGSAGAGDSHRDA